MEQVAILDVLRRHASMIAALCIVAGLAGYAFSYLITERYAASALVLVRPQQAINLDERKLDKELFDFPVNPSMPVETPSKTYIEIIKSGALIEKVVRSLNLDKKQDRSGALWGFIPEYLKENAQQFFKDLIAILKYGRPIPDDPFTEAVKEVQNNLSLASREDTYVFEIKYMAKDPQLAAEIANKTARSFIEYMEEIRLSDAQHVRDHLQTQLAESRQQLVDARERLESSRQLRTTLRDLKLQELDVQAAQTTFETVAKEFKEADINHSYPMPEVRLVSEAVAPHEPTSPVRVKFALIAIFGGLIVGVGLALFLEYTNRRVRGIDDVEDFIGVKVLATIPRVSRRRWRRAGLR